jgi:Zn-dependent protease
MGLETLAYALAWVIIFVISATFHEAAHSWAAKIGGDLTAYEGGQVSLDPIPHIRRQPFGMLLLPLISAFLVGWPFGFASAPYDPIWAHNHPRKAAWMAAAGPAANLLLVIVCALAILVGIAAGVFVEPMSVTFRQIVDSASGGAWTGVAIFLSMGFTLNLIMFVLNLIPLPPLDGSGVISLFLSESKARSYRAVIANPMFGFLGLLLVWQVISPLINIVFPTVMNVLYPGADFR